MKRNLLLFLYGIGNQFLFSQKFPLKISIENNFNYLAPMAPLYEKFVDVRTYIYKTRESYQWRQSVAIEIGRVKVNLGAGLFNFNFRTALPANSASKSPGMPVTLDKEQIKYLGWEPFGGLSYRITSNKKYAFYSFMELGLPIDVLSYSEEYTLTNGKNESKNYTDFFAVNCINLGFQFKAKIGKSLQFIFSASYFKGGLRKESRQYSPSFWHLDPIFENSLAMPYRRMLSAGLGVKYKFLEKEKKQ